MYPSTKLRTPPQEEKESEKGYPFRELVGCLMYIVAATSPDVLFALERLARHFEGYNWEHWCAAKIVLRSLKVTMSYGLCFSGSRVRGYCYSADVETKRSFTSFSMKFGYGPFIWKSYSQKVEAHSAGEVRYVALGSCTKDAAWKRKLLSEFGVDEKMVPLSSDGTCAIENTKDETESRKLKKIDVANKLSEVYVT